MLKECSICAALILAAAVFAHSAEARHGGFGGGRSMGGFGGARVGQISGARMSGFSGARAMAVAGHGKNGIRRSGQVRWSYARGSGPSCWAGRGNWSGNRWAGNWRGGHWRGGRFWPWGVGAGVALAAALPYYGGYDWLRIFCPVGARLWLGERLQLSVLWRLRLLLITSYLTYLRGHPKVAPLALNSSFRSLLR